MRTTLIICTYNWENALEMVLLSVKNQSVLPNEIIIADDGSKESTKELVDQFKNQFSIPLLHVWHEDDGFRKCKILNQALRLSKGNYIIQVDGDVVLHRHFIKDHLANAKKDTFLVGSRVFLNEIVTQNAFQKKQLFINFLSKGIKNNLNSIYLPFLSSFMKQPIKEAKKVVEAVRGCNTSYWKKDIVEVNGYDETMTGWGREDSELAVRFVNKGVKRNRIKFAAIQYHLYHKENSRNRFNINDEILALSVKENRITTEFGMKQS